MIIPGAPEQVSLEQALAALKPVLANSELQRSAKTSNTI